MRITLDRVISALALSLCIWSLFSIVEKREWWHFKNSDEHAAPLRGKAIKSASLTGETSLALVAVLSTSCPFCKENIPFYETVSGWRAPGKFSFVVTFIGSSSHGRVYLQKHGVSFDEMLPNLNSLPTRATPTLLLVRDGVVEDVWVGYLNEVGQKAVAAAVKRSCPTCTIS